MAAGMGDAQKKIEAEQKMYQSIYQRLDDRRSLDTEKRINDWVLNPAIKLLNMLNPFGSLEQLAAPKHEKPQILDPSIHKGLYRIKVGVAKIRTAALNLQESMEDDIKEKIDFVIKPYEQVVGTKANSVPSLLRAAFYSGMGTGQSTNAQIRNIATAEGHNFLKDKVHFSRKFNPLRLPFIALKSIRLLSYKTFDTLRPIRDYPVTNWRSSSLLGKFGLAVMALFVSLPLYIAEPAVKLTASISLGLLEAPMALLSKFSDKIIDTSLKSFISEQNTFQPTERLRETDDDEDLTDGESLDEDESDYGDDDYFRYEDESDCGDDYDSGYDSAYGDDYDSDNALDFKPPPPPPPPVDGRPDGPSVVIDPTYHQQFKDAVHLKNPNYEKPTQPNNTEPKPKPDYTPSPGPGR